MDSGIPAGIPHASLPFPGGEFFSSRIQPWPFGNPNGSWLAGTAGWLAGDAKLAFSVDSLVGFRPTATAAAIAACVLWSAGGENASQTLRKRWTPLLRSGHGTAGAPRTQANR